MLKNYLKIIWRNLVKNKTFSFINISGLSVGLTCCMLISVYLYHELSYDSYHKNIDRLYQLGTTFVKDGREDRTVNTPAPMAGIVHSEFPEIENTTRLLKTYADDKTLLQYTTTGGEIKSFYETSGYVADSSFFKLLTYNFKEGNPATALLNPNSVVISDEIENKIFGNEPALNKVLHISGSTNGDYDFKITGVFIPSKLPTHIDARFIMSLNGGDVEKYISTRTDLASNNMFYTYLLLKPGTNARQLEEKFPAFIDKFAGKDLKAMGFYKKQFLVRVKDLHLYANTTTNVSTPGSITTLYILGSIALFTLLIAVINFMNLSTARSLKRSTEVGMRKVLGAEKGSLIRLFLAESLVMTFIAFIFAISLTQILLPLFTKFSGKEISLSFLQTTGLFLGFILLTIITGLLAGSYPAFYMSSFKPVKALKGKSGSYATAAIRKFLVVFQFAISVILIISTVIIISQMHYMDSKDLGFDKDRQIIIPLRTNSAKSIYVSLKNSIRQLPEVVSVGASKYYPGIDNPSDMSLYKENQSMNEAKRVFMNGVDDSFLETLNFKLAAGRMFGKDFPADTNFRMILNEEGIKQIGFASPSEAIGRYVVIDWKGKTYRWEVIGVLKDFHFKGLHDPIEPIGFQLNEKPEYNYVLVHAAANEMAPLLKSIEKIWVEMNPGEPFEFSFLDQDFRKNYESDSRLSAIVYYFTGIAILISCLGLFGLAAFSAERRTKEIGIRKVMGASVSGIVTLLSRDYLVLVFIAILIATPAAWYIMKQWLQDFAYRVEINFWMLAAGWVLTIFIAILTVSFQAVKSALANPAKSLKYE